MYIAEGPPNCDQRKIRIPDPTAVQEAKGSVSEWICLGNSSRDLVIKSIT